MCYGCESWVLRDQRSRDCVHCSIMKLYRRFLVGSPDSHLSDEEVLAQGPFLSPTEVLRRARLRYLGTLYRGARQADWGILGGDSAWLQLLQDDCIWLWHQLRRSSSLQDPVQHFASWDYLLRYHPTFWKRLVNRGCEHAVQQRRNGNLVRDLHRRLFASLQRAGTLACVAPQYEKPYQPDQHFGCMSCGLRCASRGGEGAHFFRKHGVRASTRFLSDGTQCPHCLKEYHTGGKLQAHLARSRVCRGVLRARRLRCAPLAGIGSCEQQQAVRAHDGLLPPLPAQLECSRCLLSG
eukprot:s2841_g10.t1